MVATSREPWIPNASECVISAMLDRVAEQKKDDTFIAFQDGTEWTYLETRAAARSTAAGLARIGVNRGDRVLVWLPNGPDIIRISIGLSYLGAIFVPVNLALRGNMLSHIIEDSQAELMICHTELADRLYGARHSNLKRIIEIGGGVARDLPLNWQSADCLVADEKDFTPPAKSVEPWDIGGIYYTSGTTGQSKGVLSPHLHVYAMAMLCMRFVEEKDRIIINVPYFHIGGALLPYVALAKGASLAVLNDFRAQEFWNYVRKLKATVCMFFGSTPNFLMKMPEREGDNDHTLRAALQQPLCYDVPAFAKRFGVDIYTGFDLSELGQSLMSDRLPTDRKLPKGYCGKAHDLFWKFDVRLVDDFDREVPVGEPGELMVRCNTPWVISPGYYGRPEETAKAWRNGWFHTGDTLRREADGSFYFVDRKKDAIRRRGENISSSELEDEVLAYDPVELCAAIATKSDLGEDEVMVVVKPKQGATIDPEALTRFMIERVPHYMVPRYVRVLEEMPMSGTDKIRKPVLREAGVTADTWDREKAGIVVKSKRIV